MCSFGKGARTLRQLTFVRLRDNLSTESVDVFAFDGNVLDDVLRHELLQLLVDDRLFDFQDSRVRRKDNYFESLWKQRDITVQSIATHMTSELGSVASGLAAKFSQSSLEIGQRGCVPSSGKAGRDVGKQGERAAFISASFS